MNVLNPLIALEVVGTPLMHARSNVKTFQGFSDGAAEMMSTWPGLEACALEWYGLRPLNEIGTCHCGAGEREGGLRFRVYQIKIVTAGLGALCCGACSRNIASIVSNMLITMSQDVWLATLPTCS